MVGRTTCGEPTEAFVPYATLGAWSVALLALPALHPVTSPAPGAPLLTYLGALIALTALAGLGVTRAGRRATRLTWRYRLIPGDGAASSRRRADGERTADDRFRVRARFADGDPDAVRAVYRAYGRLVYAVAYRLLADRGLSEEATQQTFLKAWQASASVDPNRELGPWLATIARAPPRRWRQ